MSYHIQRLRVTNYRGIGVLDTPVSDAGMIIQGCNGGGKTSVIRALRAALAGQDIGEDAIRIGTDRAEILVDIDHHTVRRVITPSGSKITIEGPDGSPKRSPQKWLTELLGTSPLDPIDLFGATPRDRRRQILAALPVRVARAQVEASLPEWARGDALETDYDRHGLEVLSELRERFAAERKRIASIAKARQVDLTAARDALKADANAPDGGTAEQVEAARRKLAAAERARDDLIARAGRVAGAEARNAGTRARIAELLATAAEQDALAVRVPDADFTAADAEVTAAVEEEQRIAALLTEAQARASRARMQRARLANADKAAAEAADRAAAARASAAEFERAIAAATEPAPTDAEHVEAGAEVVRAGQEATIADAALRKAQAAQAVANASAQLREADEREGQLNGVIDTLAKDLPNRLLADANGIPGLALNGDDILLDGVSILGLSGREQLLFAVDVARRANAVAKLLIVDGLERIDPDMMPAFLERATADGYQLIATRVERGDVQLVMIGKEGA